MRPSIDRLRFHGVKQPPEFDEVWNEYRRAVIWGFWVGWAGGALSRIMAGKPMW
jgi:hypothetical protein